MPERQPQLSQEFRDFLVEAKLSGYGSDAMVKTRPESGATEIVYEQDGWRYTDNYIGGNPYAGYETVAAKKEDDLWMPVWGMSYRGKSLDPELRGDEMGQLLGGFLSEPDQTMPIRGPLNAWDTTKNYRYRLTHSALSRLEDFEAGEQIYRADRIVYTARFLGGLVNIDHADSEIKKPWLA